jgi:hypothetical protein
MQALVLVRYAVPNLVFVPRRGFQLTEEGAGVSKVEGFGVGTDTGGKVGFGVPEMASKDVVGSGVG